jgi:hypothetical protein
MENAQVIEVSSPKKAPRCHRITRETRMSGRGGMPSLWYVDKKCRLDDGHDGACDFSRGPRIYSVRP